MRYDAYREGLLGIRFRVKFSCRRRILCNRKMLKLPQRTDPLGFYKKVYIKTCGEGRKFDFFYFPPPPTVFLCITFSHDPVALFHYGIMEFPL